MNRTSVKIAALTPVTMAAVGLTQLHYLVSHFATIAELTAAVTVGTAIWVGKGRKGRQEEAPVTSEARSWQLPGYQALPPAAVPGMCPATSRPSSSRRNSPV